MELILKYFGNTLTPKQIAQFEALGPLYEEWNQKINVISRKDIDQFYERHVLHSLSIAKEIEFEPGTKILDLGTGGGFPGIPLAIFFPDVSFYLVDSIGKKITVVNEVVQALGLTNVSAAHIRVEEVKDKFDFVVTRAVAPLGELCRWINGKIEPKDRNGLSNGILCLKGGDLKSEIKESRQKAILLPISSHFKEDFFETKAILYAQL